MGFPFEKVKVAKIGDDLYLPLPKNVAELMKVREGDELEVVGLSRRSYTRRRGTLGRS